MKIDFNDSDYELVISGAKSIGDIIKSLDDENTPSLSGMCVVTEEYGIRNKSHFGDLKRMIDEYKDMFSVDINLDLIREYIFRMRFEGKIGDILGLFSVLNISNRFTDILTHMKNDMLFINGIFGNSSTRREAYDYNRCLTLRLLADLNKHDNIPYIHDQVKNLSLTSSLDLLRSSFETVYGKDIEDLGVDSNSDEMSTDSIDDDKLEVLKKSLIEMINGGDNSEGE